MTTLIVRLPDTVTPVEPLTPGRNELIAVTYINHDAAGLLMALIRAAKELGFLEARVVDEDG
jgi:hypothetical protein